MQLREIIKNTIDTYRDKFPDSFIQVKVDPEGLQLKLSRRAKVAKVNNFEVIRLEDSVMDLGTVSNHPLAMDTLQEGASSL